MPLWHRPKGGWHMRKYLIALLIISLGCLSQAEIIVNPYGYLPFSKKEAITTIEAENFQLRTKSSGREQFKGQLEGPFIDRETGEEVYRLNFTDKVRGGEYYLSVNDTDSQIIKIDSATFNPVFQEAMAKLTEKRSKYGWLDDNGEENILLSSYLAGRGLSFYETFSDRFGDGELNLPANEGNNKIPDYLDEMIHGAKGLLLWQQEGELMEKDPDEIAATTAVLAIAGRVLPQADGKLAKTMADQAQVAVGYLQANRNEEVRADLKLWLLTEMNLLTDNKEYEEALRTLLQPVVNSGWGPVSTQDVTGLALAEMMKKNLPKDDPMYDLYMGRGVGILIAHSRDPYYRPVAFEPIETEIKATYLESPLPAGLGSEGLYVIDLNEYYRTNTWVRVGQDQLHYLLGRNRSGIDYFKNGDTETVFHIALLSAYFKDSSTLTRSGKIVSGAFKITFYFVLILLGITFWQKYSAKKASETIDE